VVSYLMDLSRLLLIVRLVSSAAKKVIMDVAEACSKVFSTALYSGCELVGSV